MTKKSILIQEFHHKELVKISKVFGTNYGDLIQSMILYFKKTGINPTEAINENPAAMVKVLDKRIVSFLKVQERDILKPLRNDVHEYSLEQKKQYDDIKLVMNTLMEWVKESIIKINDFDSNRTRRTNTELEKIRKDINKQKEALKLISELIDNKNKHGIQAKIKSLFQ